MNELAVNIMVGVAGGIIIGVIGGWLVAQVANLIVMLWEAIDARIFARKIRRETYQIRLQAGLKTMPASSEARKRRVRSRWGID
jgi:cytidylate kinase